MRKKKFAEAPIEVVQPVLDHDHPVSERADLGAGLAQALLHQPELLPDHAVVDIVHAGAVVPGTLARRPPVGAIQQRCQHIAQLRVATLAEPRRRPSTPKSGVWLSTMIPKGLCPCPLTGRLSVSNLPHSNAKDGKPRLQPRMTSTTSRSPRWRSSTSPTPARPSTWSTDRTPAPSPTSRTRAS